MKKIEAIIKTFRLDKVKEGLTEIGIVDMTILLSLVISILILNSCSKKNGRPPSSSGASCSASTTTCGNSNNLTNIPSAYLTALTKYTTTNSTYAVNVCTEDTNGDGSADYMVIESSNRPNHKSYYWQATNALYEAFDFATNIYKYAATVTTTGYSGTPRSAGTNMIMDQCITMKMPIGPEEAITKSNTELSTIGLAINGVSFFNENAAPGDEITNELFTFDQCSGHPQRSGVYHYHVDPVCLIKDSGGSVTDNSTTDGGTTYSWIEDSGTNGGLLLGFLLDGFPVYGPVGDNHTDYSGSSTPSIDNYNGHTHSTTEFQSGIYHYHVKTANIGGTNSTVFWVTNAKYYGSPGSITVR
jgi:hypothetical protein